MLAFKPGDIVKFKQNKNQYLVLILNFINQDEDREGEIYNALSLYSYGDKWFEDGQQREFRYGYEVKECYRLLKGGTK